MLKFQRYPLFWKLTLPVLLVNLIWGAIIIISALEMKKSRVLAHNLHTENITLLLQLQSLESKFSGFNQLLLMHVASADKSRTAALSKNILAQQRELEADFNRLAEVIRTAHAHASAQFAQSHQTFQQYMEASAEILAVSEDFVQEPAFAKLQKLTSAFQYPINKSIADIIRFELNFMQSSYEQSQAIWQKNIATLLGTGAAAFLLSLAFLYRVINGITRRLSRVTVCADTLGKGDLSARVEKDGHEDEVSRLGNGLAVMAGKIKESTDLLHESEAQTRMLLNSTGEAIYGIDVNGYCTFSNKACLQMLGYESDSELLGKNIHTLIHYAHADGSPYPADECPVHNSIRTGQAKHRDEEVLWRKDGSKFRVDYRAHPMIKNGEVIGAVVSFLDTTERTITEEALQRNFDLLNDAQEIGHVGSWEWNIKDNTLQWTDEIYRIFGFAPQEFIVDYDIFLKLVHPEDREFVYQAVQKSLADQRPYDINHRICRADGSERIVNEKGKVVDNETGVPLFMVGTVQDITEIKRIEKNLRRYQEQLEELVSERTMELQTAKEEADKANQAKSLFLASMSHELRTPLNSISGFGQLLLTDSKNPLTIEQKGQLKKILASGNHLLKLIDDVLNLSKIESGTVDISLQPIDACSVLLDTIEFIQEMAKTYQVEIIPGELDRQVYIDVDDTRFRQILMNLLSNAIKYNRPQGTVGFSCKAADGRLRIMISDTGFGISSEKSSLLFEPFSRLGAETSSIEGTGIGLTITKRLVEFMNGHIGYESEVGQGSEFWIDFPIVQPHAKHSSSVPELKQASSLLPEGKYTILYVEDDQLNRDLLLAILARTPNLQLLTAENGAQGVDMAVQHRPDLIFMDIGLPDMDGFTALRKLHEHSATRDIPVVALSGDAMPMDIKNALDAGFVEYITKPINIAHLYQVLGEVIRKLAQPVRE